MVQPVSPFLGVKESQMGPAQTFVEALPHSINGCGWFHPKVFCCPFFCQSPLMEVVSGGQRAWSMQ